MYSLLFLLSKAIDFSPEAVFKHVLPWGFRPGTRHQGYFVKTVSGLFLDRRPLVPGQCGTYHSGLSSSRGPSRLFHVGPQQNLRCPRHTVAWLPAVWGSSVPAHSELRLGPASLMLWDTLLWLLKRVDWTPGDRAEFLGRLLPAPGFLRATGVGSWSGRFLPFLPRCLPAPL